MKARPQTSVGPLLKQWRERRKMSQLGLATEADLSARHLSFVETGRHLSFVETGRAQPSRDLVLHLSRVLEVPLRARNELLTAAGFAPIYRETPLDAPELAQVRRAVDFILAQQEPYPALVLDRHWNILMANAAMGRVIGLFLGPEQVTAAGAPNVMRLTYHPQGLRSWIVNWEETASAYIQWLHRDLLRTGDEKTRALLDELLGYPGIPRAWLAIDLDASTEPFLAMEFRKGDVAFSFFTTIASLGTPYDVTLHELRVESFFPADEATDRALRRLAAA
jgi:transcriptional regulator with XRE-family HTH domain